MIPQLKNEVTVGSFGLSITLTSFFLPAVYYLNIKGGIQNE